MRTSEIILKVYPIYEAKGFEKSPAVIKLGKHLDRIYNQGGTWTINNIKPTANEVAELYDVYKYIVHDKVPVSSITTISKNVMEILKSLGFNIKTQGVGWALTESDSTIYKVTGYYDTYANTSELAEYNIEDEDFGDLINVEWEKDFEEDTMDGKRNDLVHVTYIVTGLLEVPKGDDPEDYDIGNLEYVTYEINEGLTIHINDPKKGKLYKSYNQVTIYKNKGLFNCYDPKGKKFYDTESAVDAERMARNRAGINESTDDEDEEESSYIQPKGTYNVLAFANEYMEPVSKPYRFTDPGKAIEQWFKLSKKYPTCVMITGYKKDAQAMRDWAVKNEYKMKEWYDKYGCPYKFDYLMDACNKPVLGTFDKYPDQIHPFDLG